MTRKANLAGLLIAAAMAIGSVQAGRSAILPAAIPCASGGVCCFDPGGYCNGLLNFSERSVCVVT